VVTVKSDESADGQTEIPKTVYRIEHTDPGDIKIIIVIPAKV
jgi:hypothetical protein